MRTKQIAYVNTEEGIVLVSVKVTRWGRLLSLRRSGKLGVCEDGFYFTAHPSELKRLKQGYDVAIRNDWT